MVVMVLNFNGLIVLSVLRTTVLVVVRLCFIEVIMIEYAYSIDMNMSVVL
jgi:hypothetical protein